MTLTFIAIILMIIWIPLFVWTEYQWKQKYYIFTKTFSSILFLTIGILGHFANISPKEYSIFIIVALIFGLLGDVLLVFSDKLSFFKLGLSSFLLGQIVYGALFLYYGGFVFLDIIIFVILISVSLVISAKSNLEFGKMKIPTLIYLIAISFMYTMGLSTIYKDAFNAKTTAAIIIGTTLFAASDLVLAFGMFKDASNPILNEINLLLYYYGQMVLAASIITFL